MNRGLILVVLILCTVGLSFGQRGPGPFRASERVEQFKKLRMIEALKLDDETAIKFFAKYNKHEEVVRDINKQRDDLLDQLESQRKSKASDADMEKVISNLLVLDTKQAEERNRFVNDLKGVLTTGQIADLLLFERNFARNVRQIMQEMARQRREGMR